MSFRTGLDTLIADDFALLRDRRIGLLTNPSAVDARLVSAYRVLTDAPGVTVTALFGAEHGFAGTAKDGEAVGSAVDPRTGIPVYSLYGEHLAPTADMLRDVDVLVVDIQDVGVRYYTYAWTVSYLLEAAGARGLPVIVLDRPNPLGGAVVEGPLLERAQASFVGRFPVPVRHGLTLGELAQMVNARWNPTPAALTVVRCEGWCHAHSWADLGRPWVPPSPALAHLSSARHYPGACLIEGTQLSEGRGTGLPFEIAGAPWIDAEALVDHLNGEGWGERLGARFRPHTFQPTGSKWAGEVCGGVQVHEIDSARWRPLDVWLGLIIAIRRLYPDAFAWLPPDPASGMQHFDRLIGAAWVRRQIEADVDASVPTGAMLGRFAAEWADDSRAFELERQPYLLYD